MAKLARAVAHCHEQGALHRDLKPGNVVLRGREPVLVDFGLTRDLEASILRSRLSVRGRGLGTPGYWSPEQANGALEAMGPTTDVWGLGAVLFAALTGQPPCQGETFLEALAALAREQQPPSSVRQGVPPTLEAVCLACLARPSGERYARALDVAEALEGWLRDRHRRPGRLPLASLAAATAIGAAGVAVALGLFLSSRGPRWAPAAPAARTEAPAPGPRPLAAGPSAARALVEEARAAWRVGQLDRAMELADALLARDDAREAWATAHLVRAQVLHTREDRAAAVQAAQRAQELAGGPAERALAAGLSAARLEEARARLEEAATLHDADAAYWRGLLRQLLGETPRAIEDYGRAIALDPNYAIAYVNRGVARKAQGDLTGAIADYSRAIELDPGSSSAYAAHTNRGVARQDQGDLTGAIEDCTRAIEIDPRLADAHYDRGVARKAQGDLPGAIEDWTRAIAIDPRHARAHSNRGIVRADQGDLAGAIEDLERAAALFPPGSAEAAQAREGLAAVRAPGEDDLPAAPPTGEGGPPADTRRDVQRGQACMVVGDWTGATEAYGRVLLADPRDAGSWANRGLAHLRLGRWQAAIDDYSRSLELEPRWPRRFANRGEARASAGDLRGAAEDFSRAIGLEPGHAWHLVRRGWVRGAQGDLQGAVADLDRALALDPRSAEAHGLRGDAWTLLGEPERARSDHQRAWALDPTLQARTYLARPRGGPGARQAWSAAQRQRYEELEREVRQLARQSPIEAAASAPLYLELAAMEEELGREAEALELVLHGLRLQPESVAGQRAALRLEASGARKQEAARRARFILEHRPPGVCAPGLAGATELAWDCARAGRLAIEPAVGATRRPWGRLQVFGFQGADPARVRELARAIEVGIGLAVDVLPETPAPDPTDARPREALVARLAAEVGLAGLESKELEERLLERDPAYGSILGALPARQLSAVRLLEQARASHGLRPAEPALRGVLGVTHEDIHGGPGTNFVFSQWDRQARVGVLSYAGLGSGFAEVQALLAAGRLVTPGRCTFPGCALGYVNGHEDAARKLPLLCPECREQTAR